MAATRKSAKRTAGKKRGAKRASAKKRPARKAASKRARKTSRAGTKRAKSLKRRAQQGLRAARGAGEKTWKVLKSTTATIVEGVRDRLGEDSNRDTNYR